jgi:hypothetical protein
MACLSREGKGRKCKNRRYEEFITIYSIKNNKCPSSFEHAMKRPCSRSLGTELGWITAHTNSSTALLPYSESGKFIPSKGMVCVGCRGRGYLPCPHCKGSGVGPYHFGFFVYVAIPS